MHNANGSRRWLMNVFFYKLSKLLSDINELTALPTASDSHAASLLPTFPSQILSVRIKL